MNRANPENKAMTVEKCKRTCFDGENGSKIGVKLRGGRYFPYAALWNGEECLCGDMRPQAPVARAECNLPCAGDSSQMCGGSRPMPRISVYQDSSERPSYVLHNVLYPGLVQEKKTNPTAMTTALRVCLPAVFQR